MDVGHGRCPLLSARGARADEHEITPLELFFGRGFVFAIAQSSRTGRSATGRVAFGYATRVL
jgi:hypothetical protein